MKKKSGIDFKYNLRVYWEFARNYKLLYFAIFVTILLFEITLISDKFLFKWLVDTGTDFTANKLSKMDFVSVLKLIAGIFFGVILLRVIAKWFHLHFLNRLEVLLMMDLKRKYFNHIIHLSYKFHTTHRTGSLISKLVRAGSAIERMTDVVVHYTAPLILQLVVVGISLVYLDWFSAVVLIGIVVLFIVFSFMVQLMQRKANLAANEAEDREKAYISDVFMNIDSIKYFGKEENIKNKFRKVTDWTRQAFLRHWSYYKWLEPFQQGILAVGIFFLVYFPVVGFLHHDLTIGTVVFIFTVVGSLMGHIFSFVHGMREFYRTMADFEYLFRYGKIENDIKDQPGAKDLTIEEGTVDFHNMSFKYHKRPLFKGFDLRVNKNEKVALVGHSGCGKTTLMKLLYRLYDVNQGAILIDGEDICDFRQESLRSELSIVPQECILFDDSIYNNIAFSKPNATRKEVFDAIRFAQLDAFVRSLPKKEDTVVGERGVKLSGGEKQRVSIARAILANKKILVLDEATSSLDSHTEHEIQRDLQRLMRGRTSIIIAHRLSTIMRADKIVVIHKGKIVQLGNHRQLIKKKGEYHKLWNLQKGGYIN
ncbi:MAG: ABC transporter ATP-binding protein [Nanoarchaeota archaeon]